MKFRDILPGALMLGMFAFGSLLQAAQPSFLSRMNRFQFYSQANQDKFVYTLFYGLMGKQDAGYYLEIGAGDPICNNNTYFFEKNLQWKGTSIDITHAYVQSWNAVRVNPLLIEDATQSDYSSILQTFPQIIDYLSLDVDGHYHKVLEKLACTSHVFKVITIEHDFYRYGDIYRSKERQILEDLGYYLLCSDVLINGFAFEDWWIHPDFFSPNMVSALASLDLQSKDSAAIIRALKRTVPGVLKAASLEKGCSG